jgi:AmmeMemoRadiSam system protein A
MFLNNHPPSRFTDQEKEQLLQLAADSIEYGLHSGRPAPVRPADYSETLRQPGASFVTLYLHEQLRGCIGTLEAMRALITDVAANAHAAAYSDPRFHPVNNREIEFLEISISVLSAPEPMNFSSEEDLLAQLRPGVDGLILQEGRYRGTFLPSVWDTLTHPQEFLCQLKRKAGLAPDYWSATLQVQRYTAEYIK